MESLPTILALLVTSSVSLTFETDILLMHNNYVTPSEKIGCSDNMSPCLTLQEYVSQPQVYFANNTMFTFESGSHTLNSSLSLVHIHNFTFQGLSYSEVLVSPLVNVTWESCWNIKVSSIIFISNTSQFYLHYGI